jgi:SAM-dependent methyltransferase
MDVSEKQKRLSARRRELMAMRAAFQALPSFDLSPDEELERIFATYVALIPGLHSPALAAQERSALTALIASADDPALKLQAARLVAESDIKSGIVYSARVRQFPDLWEKVQPELLAHEAAYGAPVFSRQWKSYSRGKTLAFYFAGIGPYIEGRRILHVAPEAELAAWFSAQAPVLGVRYETVNLGGDVHFVEDLTALDLPDASFDWVICHRVLEHIFDDGAAIGEAWRILRHGGVLNVSVPESMQVPRTDMWAIPDLSHHHHYRQYGADFADKLASAGFEVEVVDWLLQQPAERLDAAGAYPLRMYNARKG